MNKLKSSQLRNLWIILLIVLISLASFLFLKKDSFTIYPGQGDYQRKLDVLNLGSLVITTALTPENLGEIYTHIPDTDIEICKPTASDCSGMLDLAELTGTEEIPSDPDASSFSSGTRYFIHKTKKPNPDSDEFQEIFGYSITVSAPDAEGGQKISTTSNE